MWQRQVAIDNHEEIIKRAELVLDRVVDFMANFDTVEDALAKAAEAVAAMRELSATRGRSIDVAVRNLAQLGIKSHKVKGKNRPADLAKIEKRANYIEGIDMDAAIEIESAEEVDTTPEETANK